MPESAKTKIIRVPPETLKQLKELAAADYRTVTHYVAFKVNEWYEHKHWEGQ